MSATTNHNERSFGIFLKRFHVHKNLFSKKECARIIRYFEGNTSERASVVDVEESKEQIVPIEDTEVRDGRIVFCRHNDVEMNFAFQKLYYASIWANFGWSLLPLRFLQIAEYDANQIGGFYQRHRDIIENSKPQRIISAVTQLSAPEEYTGCNLIFDDDSNAPDTNEYCNIGDTIFFTSIEPHEVTPVLTGKRYSLTAWFEGPTIWNDESEYYV
jgi:2OG-Fe(II) oxygenase superfamily